MVPELEGRSVCPLADGGNGAGCWAGLGTQRLWLSFGHSSDLRSASTVEGEGRGECGV